MSILMSKNLPFLEKPLGLSYICESCLPNETLENEYSTTQTRLMEVET